jgi:hypothetical protein
MTATQAEISASFARVFGNGRGEAGLEVGVDPGLPEAEYIRIPRGMRKAWAADIEDTPENKRVYLDNLATLNPTVPSGTPSTSPIAPYPGTVAACAGRFGWVIAGRITIVGGIAYAVCPAGRVALVGITTRAPTYEDAASFFTVNQGHIRDAELRDTDHRWVHAVRFWSVVAGLVTAEKSDEYLEVADPPNEAAGSAEFAAFCAKFAPNAFTAAAARAGTWRKTNHATGGQRATGFAKRWLQKEGYTSSATERAQREREDKAATDAMYVATHAVSNHAVLALMASEDRGHWATIDPTYGLILEWSVKASITMRLSPKTQVAGGAMVADAWVVLQKVVHEGLAPLLNNLEQLAALKAQHDELEVHGVACATYAGWFLDGHPDGLVKRDFSQKDAASAGLIGELGHVATKYYKGTTIGDSPALASAASQLGDSIASDAWGALAAEKKTMSSEQIVKAYSAIKGGASLAQVADLLSDDAAKVQAAVDAYNAETTTAAGLVGIAKPLLVSAATVIKNRGLAPAPP